MPVFSLAADDSLVPCNNNAGIVTNSDGTVTQPLACDFTAFMTLINKVIQFVLFSLAIPIAAIMFLYAGFLLVTAGGAETKTKAKGIFTNAVIGLALAAAAWLIVRTVLSILGFQGDWIGLPFINLP